MMSNNATSHTRCSFRPAALACLFLGLTLTGCSGGKTAPVGGKVTYKGTPVKGGTIIFTPVDSADEQKPASGEIQSDGTYKLGTTEPGNGAQVGKYQVRFTPPPQQLTEAQRTDPRYIAPPPPYMGLAPKTAEVEVKSEQNSIDIELVPARR